MRFLAPATFALVAILSVVYLHAGAASAKAPDLTYQYPKDGEVFAVPPTVLQMCFSKPLDIRDLDKGGKFRFDLLRPNNLGLGMRIVFQVDGFGLAIYPGLADGDVQGPWRLEYTVRDRETLEETSGTINFSVNAAAGTAPAQATPPACSPTSTPGDGGGSTTPAGSATPKGGGNDDSGPDVLLLALLTIGAAGAAAVIALIGYWVRKKVGFSPHAPPPDGDDSQGGEHH